jgi:hypothetical protein
LRLSPEKGSDGRDSVQPPRRVSCNSPPNKNCYIDEARCRSSSLMGLEASVPCRKSRLMSFCRSDLTLDEGPNGHRGSLPGFPRRFRDGLTDTRHTDFAPAKTFNSWRASGARRPQTAAAAQSDCSIWSSTSMVTDLLCWNDRPWLAGVKGCYSRTMVGRKLLPVCYEYFKRQTSRYQAFSMK